VLITAAISANMKIMWKCQVTILSLYREPLAKPREAVLQQ
jgi:hypothetical protein